MVQRALEETIIAKGKVKRDAEQIGGQLEKEQRQYQDPRSPATTTDLASSGVTVTPIKKNTGGERE